MTTEAERHFNAAMLAGAMQLKREIGYNPTRFTQMVSARGGVGAARALLSGRDSSDGFTTLWQHRRLGMSVEALVLLPWYRRLFTDAELVTAEQRLRRHDFDVDLFLREAAQRVPGWAEVDSSEGI